MHGCEILSTVPGSMSAQAMLNAMEAASPIRTARTHKYEGCYDWLMMWGFGRTEHAKACKQHVESGKHVILWDLGYFGREKRAGYMRLSLDTWHPDQWMETTDPDPVRWRRLGIHLTHESKPEGHIVLVGMGPKSHAYLHDNSWEMRKFQELKRRFPNRKIIFRAKPGKPHALLPCTISIQGPIQDVLQGASLVVCRHSNVAVDAIVMGIPFECEEGAAKWLEGKPYTPENRVDFLYRLAWWQWKANEAKDAWDFILRVIK